MPYRRIYEQHYGPIPKDEFGRPYHIHHIDHDHNNNDPSNLMAMPVAEHVIHHKLGTTHSEETRAKMSAAHKGKPTTEEHLARLRKYNENRVRSEETKRKISENRKGKGLGPQSEETIRKKKEKRKLQVFSPETKAKMAEAQKRRWERYREAKATE